MIKARVGVYDKPNEGECKKGLLFFTWERAACKRCEKYTLHSAVLSFSTSRALSKVRRTVMRFSETE